MITKENNLLEWKKQLTGYVVPAIVEVAYQLPTVPLISIIVFHY
jgi:hypothetical protein